MSECSHKNSKLCVSKTIWAVYDHMFFLVLEKMDQIIEQQIAKAASEIESQLDDQINALDSMTSDELKTLRNQRLNELKNEAKKKQEWLNNGHGQLHELSGEKEFFEVSKKSANIIVHFYRDSTERCKIVDHHLKILSKKHIEANFCKVNAENCPFLTQRLRIKVIPTIAIIKDSKTKVCKCSTN